MKHHALFFLCGITCIALATCSGTTAPQQPAMVVPRGDSVKVPASSRYHKPGLLRQFFIGGNYRKEWGTPVTMPVLHLATTGLAIKELGGGQQTKSLKLKDARGLEWALRTVDKDVEKALPEKLRNTLAEKIVQDLISAANPYAPLVVAQLAKAVQVPAPDPKLYFVPDDPAFGEYRKIFANQICYLELRDPTLDATESRNSEYLLTQMAQDNKVLIMQEEVLRGRLLDMLIADWDRHADQWRWGSVDSAGAKYFYAIPRDRDQAFFTATGLIPRVGKAVAMQHLNWYKQDMRGLDKLNYKSREFDRIYLNELDRQDWQRIINEVVQNWNDGVIEAAVAKLPPPVLSISGKEITQKLKGRRDDMLKSVLQYYGQLATEVQVWGSKDAELFEVSNDGDKVRVQVYVMGPKQQKGLLRYDRLFDPSETKALHLDGLGGADRFEVKEYQGRKPKLYLYGDKEDAVFAVPKNGGVEFHSANKNRTTGMVLRKEQKN
ncbi:hypothetical protein SAMN05444008_104114 [Cnuella takakiae]|uniref:Uncharacterized protein n=1 Tax=Cnuella takakiae TaxID=1302690 RepID=A0A1M4Y1E7_9BACT|nr:hypothetical protein [Cnuella takakiae]OLY93011.1 hypothetical protein BUE76_14745 [Cnuella takakiae]SHE99416.1 hypothetical protein SAMN05444008_104114 [Cnuella takakiae]